MYICIYTHIPTIDISSKDTMDLMLGIGMCNLRCLALVLDLNEMLIVANTLKSFEDSKEALGSKLKGESDAQKLSVMSAELRQCIEDRALLRQYADNDRVWDNATDKYMSA